MNIEVQCIAKEILFDINISGEKKTYTEEMIK